MIAKLARRVHTVHTIGIKRALYAWHNNVKIKKTTRAWRSQQQWMNAIAPDAQRLLSADFQSLLTALKRRSFNCMHTLYLHESPMIIKEANKYVCRASEAMPWAVDTRLQKHNPSENARFDTDIYFADLVIEQSPTDTFKKDIRVSWELSRFQYLPVMAKAYVLTRNQAYLDTICAHIADWIAQNPFLYGPAWVNAMEVAIRAINWIATFDLIKNVLPYLVSKQLITALYQHMLYIEHRWEYYDSRTNNHYITNLVGYLYLTHFFSDIPGMQKKFDWCVAQLLQELDKQVFDEGTSYEGSTAYHNLVTELYYLAYVLLQEKRLVISRRVVAKLQRMISFLVWCTPENGALVAIGDDDSGVIIHGGLAYRKLAAIWSDTHHRQGSCATFEAFGLSIIKTDVWHVTFRHHAYHPLQPSGHFHNDVGSITVSVHGVPIFVDPGSFVYTASVVWRNYFRSTGVHNSCFIKGTEFAVPDDRLFVLELPSGTSENRTYQQDDTMYLSTRHSLYKKYGLIMQRDLVLDTHLSSLTITDTWLSKVKQHPHTSAWNFTLAADLMPVQESTDRWLLLRNGIPIVAVQSYDLVFRIQPAWVSPAYGVKIPSHALCAESGISIDKPVVIRVRSL